MKKSKTGSAIKIVIAVIIIAAIAVAALYYFKDRILAPSYNSLAPTAEKFELIKKWIPKDAEFYAAIDVPRLLATKEVPEKLQSVIEGGEGVIADFIRSLIEHGDIIGMLGFVGNIGEKGDESFATIAQGRFDPNELLPAVRAILAASHGGLVAEDVGDKTIYAESDERDPYAFIILDKKHLAVGLKRSLKFFFSGDMALGLDSAAPQGALVFGRVKLGPRIVSMLPPAVQSINEVSFDSVDGGTLTSSIACKDPPEAEKTKMFLEGVRSLILLQEEGNAAIVYLLKNFTIENVDNTVKINGGIVPVIDLLKGVRANIK